MNMSGTSKRSPGAIAGTQTTLPGLNSPRPVTNLWHIFTVFFNVCLVIKQLVTQKLFGIGRT